MPLIKKPSDPSGRTFESQCLVIFESHFDADDANFYGRSGEGQNGIDLRLTNRKDGVYERVVIQCKDMRELYWSNFRDAFKQALRTFAPRLATDPDLFYIVATTAPVVGTKHIETGVAEAIAELSAEDPRLDLTRVRHEIFTWNRIELLVENSPRLRKVLPRDAREADSVRSKKLADLARNLRLANQSRNLRAGKAALAFYRANAKVAEDDNYNWVPTDTLDEMVPLFLNAGDFEQAEKVLDVALGINPLDAGYLLGHLRARRVLTSFEYDNRETIFATTTRKGLKSVSEEVELVASDLLNAIGHIDEQLALALWMVTYARSPEVADAGLRRGRSLTSLAWPENVTRLADGDSYFLTSPGYLCRDADMPSLLPKICKSSLYASTLACVYGYIRLVHACRFGYPHTKAVEHDLGGWPRCLRGLDSGDVNFYFSALQSFPLTLVREHFPSIYAEGLNREFLWPVADELVARRWGALEDSRYGCSAAFLLRDCANGLLEQRINELAAGGFLGKGTALVISHLALERLARVHIALELTMHDLNCQLADEKRLLTGLEKLRKYVVRIEIPQREGHGQRIVSYPCYYDLSEDQRTLDSSVELSLQRRIDYLAASYCEASRAEERLGRARNVRRYWVPRLTPLY